MLRNTVARVTSLQQAARIGNISTDKLINTLRHSVGQDLMDTQSTILYIIEKPAWFHEDSITHNLDARSMLAVGEHPVNQVIADLTTMKEMQIFKLITSFLPAPLIDKAISLGYSHWVDQQNDSLMAK